MLQRCGPTLPHEDGAEELDTRRLETDLRSPIEQLLRALAHMSTARAATIRTVAQTGAPMDLVAACGLDAAVKSRIARVDPECGVCATAFHDGAMRTASNSCECVRELTGDAAGAHQVVAVALRHKEQPCGVLSLFLDGSDAAAQLPEGLLELLPALGDLVGTAMENTRQADADVLSSVMQERHLLANEVHDSLAQHLTSIRMRTSLLRNAVATRDENRAAQYLEEIDESLAVAQSRVRQIITDFRAQMDAARLLPALEYAIEELRSASGVPIELDCRVREPVLSAYEEVQVFYIAREALTNALKHSQANRVRVRLDERSGRYELLVEDNGVGLDGERAADQGHFGLNIMRERAKRIGAVIELHRREAGGTCVQLTLPARSARREEFE